MFQLNNCMQAQILCLFYEYRLLHVLGNLRSGALFTYLMICSHSSFMTELLPRCESKHCRCKTVSFSCCFLTSMIND